MKKWLQIKKDGRICSVSDKKLGGDMEQKQMTLTPSDLAKIYNFGYQKTMKNGKISFRKTHRLLKQEKRERGKSMVAKIRSGTYTNKDLADVLEDLITE